jgi:hypothetical protein
MVYPSRFPSLCSESNCLVWVQIISCAPELLWRSYGIRRVLSKRAFHAPLWYQLQYGAGEEPDKASDRATFYLQTGHFQ